MMVAEIQTEEGEPDGLWKGWLTIHLEQADTYVSIRHDYIGSDGNRDTWCDEGSGFSIEHLDAVIAALQDIRQRSTSGPTPVKT